MEKKNLSVVVITLNEEANIERCLKSAQWASEIVVYDSGSTDATVAIAQKMGAKVIQGAWLGFGLTKKKATEWAQNDWILSLDADETVSAELVSEIVKTQLEETAAYALPRLSFYLGRWIRYGGWYPDYQIRLFHRKHSQWNEASIHEKVEAKKYIKLTNCLNHYVFKSIKEHIATNNHYSGLLAEKMWAAGKRFSWFHYLTKPTVKFIECYFLKLGFLDGWPGLFIARGAGYSVQLKWAKLKEMDMK